MKTALQRKSVDSENLPATLLRLMLRVSVVLGAAVYVPSVVMLVRLGNAHAMIATDTVGLLLVVALWRFDRLPFRFRAVSTCLIFYGVGVGLLLQVGSVSQIYLFGFSVITVLLLGLRAGLVSAALSSVTMIVVGALGHRSAETGVPGSDGAAAWAVLALNFTLVNTLLTLAVGVVLKNLDGALKREIASSVALAGERTLLRTLIDALPDVVFTKDTAGRFVNGNPAMLALLGLQGEEQLAGKTALELFGSSELAAPHHADDLEVMSGHGLINREERSTDRSGRPVWYLTIKVPLRDAAGQISGLVGISRDITERKQAEAERARVLAQLELQIERMPLAYMLTDRELRFTAWNPAAERLFGFTRDQVLGKPFELIVPGGARRHFGGLFERLKSGAMDAHGEGENLTQQGATIACEWHNTPMFDEAGRFCGVLALANDVTERKKLEGQLRQAQKMDAVGQLAGGVAHDFNNLLTVILMHADLSIRELKPGAPMRSSLEEIQSAGLRAAALTRQLLLFSRKQVIEPQVFDLNALLDRTKKMLGRVIGEDIELVTVVRASFGNVRADPGSIEQVIMNLVVNARDAMPTGGKLTLETANVTLDEAYASEHLGVSPGAHVMLSVSDTGIGMNKETLARIFEPFFTTKEPGKGTGLGLSTAFGIIQQSSGSIWVYSEPGLGTTFKVYLPVVGLAADARPVPGATPRGTQTILLVEDEDSVRNVNQRILRRYGYTVLEARNAGEALLVSEAHAGTIDLLLTDVVMPKMSGPALAKRLAPSRPAMKVLCMSGYTDDAAVRHGVVHAEIAFLQKPTTVETLTQKVRAVLDA